MSSEVATASQTRTRKPSSAKRRNGNKTKSSCAKWLRNTALFEGLNDRQLVAISPPCRRLHYRAGHILVAEDHETKDLYIVLEGEVSVEAKLFKEYHLREGPVKVQKIGPGDTAGCCALVGNSPKMTVRCTKETELIAIDADELRELLATHPEIGLIVMANAFKLATERLILSRQHLLAQFGLREMYTTYRNY